jgi:hypothetical protein
LFGPVFLPLSAHQSRRLLAFSFIPLAGYRLGLRSSFPAWPICCSAFRLWSASLVWPTASPTLPSADFCDTVEGNRFTSSHDFVTGRRSPEVSSTAFDAPPPDLPPVSLMDMGFAVLCPLARHPRPLIWFLFIGSRLCSTLLSGSAPAAGVISPLRFAMTSPPSGCQRDFHPRAVEHARHTKKSLGELQLAEAQYLPLCLFPGQALITPYASDKVISRASAETSC